MLSPTQIKAREGKLTASRVAALVRGDQEVMRLYLEMTGQQPEENLDNVWAVQLGSATEKLNVEWYERKHNEVSRIGEVVVHPKLPWAACTLDAWDNVLKCPVECKHTGGREPIDPVLIDRYQPQMQWAMLCTGASQCALSVIMGTSEPVVEFIERDLEFQRDLVQRGAYFMKCVVLRTPPVVLAPIASPIPAETIYDMAGNNQWASEAVAYLETKEAFDRNEDAKKILKSLVPADAKKAHGHGVVITRNRVGNLSLREAKE